MSVNQAISQEISHSTYEIRFSELEAGLKKCEEFLKTVETLSKNLDEVKAKLVRILFVSRQFHLFLN